MLIKQMTEKLYAMVCDNRVGFNSQTIKRSREGEKKRMRTEKLGKSSMRGIFNTGKKKELEYEREKSSLL